MYAGILQKPRALQVLDVFRAYVMRLTPTQSTFQTVEYDCGHHCPLIRKGRLYGPLILALDFIYFVTVAVGVVEAVNKVIVNFFHIDNLKSESGLAQHFPS